MWCARTNSYDVILEPAVLFANLNREGCHQPCLLLCPYPLVSLFRSLGLPFPHSVIFYIIGFLDSVQRLPPKFCGVSS